MVVKTQAHIEDRQISRVCGYARSRAEIYCGLMSRSQVEKLHAAATPMLVIFLSPSAPSILPVSHTKGVVNCYVWSERKLRGLKPVEPPLAAQNLRVWLNLRRIDEVVCSPEWCVDLPHTL